MRKKKNINVGMISWWEKRLNSLNSHYNKCMVDSKEKYKFDLGVKELIAFT